MQFYCVWTTTIQTDSRQIKSTNKQWLSWALGWNGFHWWTRICQGPLLPYVSSQSHFENKPHKHNRKRGWWVAELGVRNRRKSSLPQPGDRTGRHEKGCALPRPCPSLCLLCCSPQHSSPDRHQVSSTCSLFTVSSPTSVEGQWGRTLCTLLTPVSQCPEERWVLRGRAARFVAGWMSERNCWDNLYLSPISRPQNTQSL